MDTFVHDTYININVGGVQVWPPSQMLIAIAVVLVAVVAAVGVAIAIRTRRA